jgi:hypothetical protein
MPTRDKFSSGSSTREAVKRRLESVKLKNFHYKKSLPGNG